MAPGSLVVAARGTVAGAVKVAPFAGWSSVIVGGSFGSGGGGGGDAEPTWIIFATEGTPAASMMNSM